MDFYPHRRSCCAIVVGINDYSNNPKLRNAINDAEAIFASFQRLDYRPILLKDCAKEKFDDEFFKLIDGRNQKDIIILYFAGHGFFCNGSDCIVFQDAADMHDVDGLKALQKSWKIEELYKTIRSQQDNAVVIAIIDACRTDYSDEAAGFRGTGSEESFRTRIKLPYQTFIAFATSPHAPANDGKMNHSRYTAALINEIESPNQSIERTFKNVRKAVYSGPGDQLPWEHSCLVDDFAFNFGQLDRHYGCVYGVNSFQLNKSQIDKLVDYGDYARLSSDINMYVTNCANYSIDDQFVFGRNLCQMLSRYPKLIKDFVNVNFFQRSLSGKVSHILNGFLYQLYFDENDRYSLHNLNQDVLDPIFNVLSNSTFVESQRFMQAELDKIPQHIGYTPGINDNVKYKLELETSDTGYLCLGAVTYKGQNVVFHDEIDDDVISYSDLRDYIWSQSRLPHMLVSIEPSVALDPDETILIGYIDEAWVSDCIENYFTEENRDPLDSMGNHYEFVSLVSCEILNISVNDNKIDVEGDMTISTIIYLDDEDESGAEMHFSGNYSLGICHSFSDKGIEVEPVDISINLDIRKFYE